MKVGVATVTLGGIAVLKMGRRIRMMVIQGIIKIVRRTNRIVGLLEIALLMIPTINYCYHLRQLLFQSCV